MFLQCTADSKHVRDLAGAGPSGDHVVEVEMAPPSRTPTSGSSRNSSPSVGLLSPRATTQSPPPPGSHQLPRSPAPRTSGDTGAMGPQVQVTARGSPPHASAAAAQASEGPPHADLPDETPDSRSEQAGGSDADGAAALETASLPDNGTRGADSVVSGEALYGGAHGRRYPVNENERSRGTSGQGGRIEEEEGRGSRTNMQGRSGAEGRATGKSLASSSSKSMEDGYRGREPEQERGWRRGRGPHRKRSWARQWGVSFLLMIHKRSVIASARSRISAPSPPPTGIVFSACPG